MSNYILGSPKNPSYSTAFVKKWADIGNFGFHH